MRTIPNYLTLLRILLIPVIMGAFFFESRTGFLVGAVCFMVACATDYLDGYMARMLSQTTKLGQFLDPTADKLLIASSLMMLVGFDRMSRFALIPAIIILCREILVSGLRETLLELYVPMPVTHLAKWKTAFQMLAITTLMINQSVDVGIDLQRIGELLLWIAALLTLITGFSYLRAGLRHFE